MKADCPQCDADVEIPESASRGSELSCDDCGSDLEVLSMNPPELGLIDEEYDDEDDDDF